MNCHVAIYFRLTTSDRNSVSHFIFLQIVKPPVISETFKFIESTATHVKYYYIVIGMYIFTQSVDIFLAKWGLCLNMNREYVCKIYFL